MGWEIRILYLMYLQALCRIPQSWTIGNCMFIVKDRQNSGLKNPFEKTEAGFKISNNSQAHV